MSETEHAPVKVHITADDTKVATAPSAGKIRVQTVTTKNLTAAGWADLLPYDPSRKIAWIQAGGSNIVICTDISQAQDAQNQVSGLPYPNGLVIPSTNTAPWPVEGVQRMWYAAPIAASRNAVTGKLRPATTGCRT